MPLYLISRKNVKISTKYAKKTTTISWSMFLSVRERRVLIISNT